MFFLFAYSPYIAILIYATIWQATLALIYPYEFTHMDYWVGYIV